MSSGSTTAAAAEGTYRSRVAVSPFTPPAPLTSVRHEMSRTLPRIANDT